MSAFDPRPIFILEMANNHMGSLEHGLLILRRFAEAVDAFREEFRFAFKLQYRDLDTLIHPRFRQALEYKYIKRFSETRLTPEQFTRLKAEMDTLGFLSVCTPFDEPSAGLVEQHGFSVLKIASCSLTDWPLLERVVRSTAPVIASTAGAGLEEIDRVVSFFEHRNRELALLHCVAEYPAPIEHLALGQIELLRTRYPGLRIGFSTHADPAETTSVQMAVAKGATIFERHVGVPTAEFSLNAYSASPEQFAAWLQAARDAFRACGPAGVRHSITAAESAGLRSLRRGVYAARPIAEGEIIGAGNVMLAMPVQPGQLTANDLSKYIEFRARGPIGESEAILDSAVSRRDHRAVVYGIVQRVKQMLRAAGAVVPARAEFEISHHFGIDRFEEVGATLITIVNREYCKKLVVQLPGQHHPSHLHKVKDETFLVVAGSVVMDLNGAVREYGAGDLIVVERGVPHAFHSPAGVVMEEISSTHVKQDSYYSDPAISPTASRKTNVAYWLEDAPPASGGGLERLAERIGGGSAVPVTPAGKG